MILCSFLNCCLCLETNLSIENTKVAKVVNEVLTLLIDLYKGSKHGGLF